MEVVVDGIIYQIQAQGGISRIFNEILPRMCQVDENLNISLLMSRQSRQKLPQHPHIYVKHAPYIGRFLQPFPTWHYTIHPLNEWWLRLAIGNTKDKIWHSTYYTMPKMWKGPIVVTVVDMIYELFQHLFNTIGNERFRDQKRRCILGADVVICISETTRRDVLQYYRIDASKVITIPLGYNNIFKQELVSVNNAIPHIPDPFILYVGSRAHYKRFQEFVQAYSLWKQKQDVRLIIVGGEWSHTEIEFLVELDIHNRVQLLNKVDDEALCLLYNTAAAFIHPSLYEGFGIPLLEAMACGCPIVASRIPSTIEVAGDCPIYCNPGETDNLMLALDKVLSEGRGSQRALAGLERVMNFSWHKTADQTLAVYRQALGKTKRS